MSLSGTPFDQLHLYATLGNDFTAPRGMIDDLTITAVPEPAAGFALGGLAVLGLRCRR